MLPLRTLPFGLTLLQGCLMTTRSHAVEEAAYTPLIADQRFELRLYEPHVVAEVVVTGTLEEAGNRAFRQLFNYISGANQPRTNIAMTAPVSQQRAGQKIAMTAPVSQHAIGDQWAVSFMMPAAHTLQTLPAPADPAVVLRAEPQRLLAAIRYSGRWSETSYARHKAELEQWIANRGWQPSGPAIWARYNAPFVPWFMRRNEILIPVTDPDAPPPTP
jgi:hypothetical protein